MTLSIGVTTKDRPESLRRCVASIARFFPSAQVIVFDDASSIPAAEQLRGSAALELQILRQPDAPGYIAGRNAIVKAARYPLVMLLDDDTVLLDSEAVECGAAVLNDDPSVGAIAFAQAETDGRPWPVSMQPGRSAAPAYVASFIGFAHLLRRDLFLRLGGYRAEFMFYGEEKEYCLRMLHAGFRVVYLPEGRIVHAVDPAGRNSRRYVRQVIRNDCLASLYNDPWPLLLAGIPVRLWRYRRMSATIPGGDPGGFSWMLRELRAAIPRVAARRRSVGWITIREWRNLRGGSIPYERAAHHA